MANLRKILAIKSFRISHQIHKGFATIFVKPFSSRHLQIFTMFNCRFKDYIFGLKDGFGALRVGDSFANHQPSTLK